MTEFTVMFLGCHGVGKSALVLRFVQGMYIDECDVHIQDCYRRTYLLHKKQFFLDIRDDQGCEERDESLVSRSQLVIITYDITNRSSFEKLQSYLEMVSRAKQNAPVSIVICGNKCDDSANRKVETDEGKRFAEFHGLPFIETSAKNDINVFSLFDTAITNFGGNTNEKADKKEKCTLQ